MSAAFWRGFFDVLTMRALFSPPPKYSVAENLRKAMSDFEAGLTPEQQAKLKEVYERGKAVRKSPAPER